MFDAVEANLEMMKYRTFWPRLCAGFVDGLVFLPLSGAFLWGNSFLTPGARAAVTVLLTALMLAYSVLMHGQYGQTLGKMALKVKVLDVSEARPITYRQAVLRDGPWIVLSVLGLFWQVPDLLAGGDPFQGESGALPTLLDNVSLLWVLVEWITMLTNNHRRAVHDWIAGSVVVRV